MISPSVEPFNEVRYKALMDGLECSEVSLSELKIENPNFRIDSDFFNKEVLRILSMIKNHAHYYLKPKNIVNGPFGSTLTIDSHLKNGYIPLVRSININQGFFINHNNLVFISEKDNNVIKHSQLNKDDIVLSRVGSIGFFARVDADMGTCNISSNNIGIKLNNFHEREKHYILTYLNTKFAYKLTNRRISGNVQPKLTVEEICHIPIPAFSQTFYMLISLLILKSEQVRKQLQVCYLSAEASLISALGITDFTPSTEKVTTKNFSDSFGTSGRLDAEYYQTKYDTLFAKLSAVKTYLLGDLVWIKKSVEPGSDEYLSQGIPFIRVSDLSKYGLSEPEIHLRRIPFAHMNLQPKKDTILLSKDGSVGIAYKVEKDLDIVTSGAILHLELKTNQFLPDYLTLVLNSLIVKMQAERDAGGSIIQHWKLSEIEKVVIPWLPIDRQEQISLKIQESFSLRRESKELLERAKQAVEMAIEKDEQTAMDWLSNLK